jgi:cyclopropane fatty-acyl-phospholipid synthase-like methyltransferase
LTRLAVPTSADKPFSAASERNREPILAVLRDHFAAVHRVLEIGSGTGQHAVHFAAALPHLVWQTSDRAANLPGIRQWLAEAALRNTPAPITLDVNGTWPDIPVDAVFSANTLHIMGWGEVERFFDMLPGTLRPGGVLVIYGPFNRNGAFTSEGNARFDAELRAADPRRGIRDFAAVNALARNAGLALVDDRAMPANNACLVWRREGFEPRA